MRPQKLSNGRPSIIALVVLAIAVLAEGAARAEVGQGLRGELTLGGTRLNSLRVSQSDFPEEVEHRGVTLGAAIDWRAGRLFAGANADGTLALLNQRESFVAAHAGWAADTGRSEIDLAGEAGVHFLTNLGGDLLTATDGPTATLPYAGLRLGWLYRGRQHLAHVGGWVFARADLGRTTAVAHTEVLTDHNTIHYEVGGYTAGVALRVQFGD